MATCKREVVGFFGGKSRLHNTSDLVPVQWSVPLHTASPQSVAPGRSEGTPLAPSHTEYFPAHLKEDLTHC